MMNDELQKKIFKAIAETKYSKKVQRNINSEKFYEIEDAFEWISHKELHPKLKKFETLSDSKAFVTEVWNAYKDRDKTFTIPVPLCKATPEGLSFYCHRSHRIYLALNMMTTWTILHEIAHAIQHGLGSGKIDKNTPHIHNEKFLDLLTELLREHIDVKLSEEFYERAKSLFR